MTGAIYEFFAPLGPHWSALLAGFAVIGFDGQLYRTELGEHYLSLQPPREPNRSERDEQHAQSNQILLNQKHGGAR